VRFGAFLSVNDDLKADRFGDRKFKNLLILWHSFCRKHCCHCHGYKIIFFKLENIKLTM